MKLYGYGIAKFQRLPEMQSQSWMVTKAVFERKPSDAGNYATEEEKGKREKEIREAKSTSVYCFAGRFQMPV